MRRYFGQSIFSCLSISAKTNRLFFTIGGPDGGGDLDFPPIVKLDNTTKTSYFLRKGAE
jgi:hypothetical protein